MLEREALDRALPMVEGIVLATSRMSDSAIRMIGQAAPDDRAEPRRRRRAQRDLRQSARNAPRGRAPGRAGSPHHRLRGRAEASWADGMRWRSLREAALELELHGRRIGPYPPTVAGGAAAVAELVKQPYSAVVAYNDLMAIGVIRGLIALGVRVPAGHQRRRLRQHLRGGAGHAGVDHRRVAAAHAGHDGGAQPAGHHRRRAAPRDRAGGAADSPRGSRIDRATADAAETRCRQGSHATRTARCPRIAPARRAAAQRSRYSTSPACGTTSVSGSASNAAMSTSAGSR